MNRDQAVTTLSTWFPQWRAERERLDVFDRWLRCEQDLPPSPRRATSEHKMLREIARSPYMGLVVTGLGQTLVVDGYRSPNKPSTDADAPQTGPPSPWDIFLANNLDALQSPIHEGALGLGYAFATIMPGKSPDGRSMASIRGVSARNMYATWADPAHDDWPMFALEFRRQGTTGFLVYLYEDGVRHTLSCDTSGTGIAYIQEETHGADFCPVARCANRIDLEGRTPSEIEPLLKLARRIDKTMYDRLLIQHFLSWKVRTIAGLAQPDPPEGLTEEQRQAWLQSTAAATKMRLSQEDILVAEDPDTKFGTLDATSLADINAAHEADLEDLSATSQMARQNFGQMVNMPAEAFAAAETNQQRRSGQRRRTFTKFWNQTLRAGALMSGNLEAAGDYQAHVTWADTESRSMAQAADALGKLAAQLNIPPEGLWERIPGVTDTDIATWRELAKSGDGMGDLAQQLQKIADANPVAPPAPAA